MSSSASASLDPYQFAVLRALPERDVLLVAVGVALTDARERLLLHEKAGEGWQLPGGHVNPGESLEDAARRETQEETGVTPLDLTLWTVASGPGAFVQRGERRAYDVTAIFRATTHAGELATGPESRDVAWFPLNALPGSAGRTVRTVAHALASGAPVPVLTVP